MALKSRWSVGSVCLTETQTLLPPPVCVWLTVINRYGWQAATGQSYFKFSGSKQMLPCEDAKNFISLHRQSHSTDLKSISQIYLDCIISSDLLLCLSSPHVASGAVLLLLLTKKKRFMLSHMWIDASQETLLFWLFYVSRRWIWLCTHFHWRLCCEQRLTSIVLPLPGGPNSRSPLAGVRSPVNS